MTKQIFNTGKPGAQPVYQNKPLREHVDDSYKMRGKLSEPSLCQQCGAVYHEGHWRWLPKPEEAHQVLCPACQRIRDDAAAGFLGLEGEFFAQHHDEILNLVHHVEKREKAEHPLQRIMNITEDVDTALITTTDVHLARGIGEAIRHAYQGQLDYEYSKGENMIRACWKH